MPDGTFRKKIEAAYAIPFTAWETAPGVTFRPVTRTQIDVTVSGDRVTELCTLLGDLRARRRREDLTANDFARLAIAEGQLVERIARLEAAERLDAAMLEARIVREHPEWQRLRGLLVDALQAYPDAARAVLAAIDNEKSENANAA